MKKLIVLLCTAFLLTACASAPKDPGRVGQMYFASVSFELSGNELTASSKKLLDETVKVYKKNPTAKIEVRGYSDASGNEKSNLILSQQRADTVAQALQARGVPAEKIKAKGYGAKKPLASNSTPEGRQQNRRVEIEFPYPEN